MTVTMRPPFKFDYHAKHREVVLVEDVCVGSVIGGCFVVQMMAPIYRNYIYFSCTLYMRQLENRKGSKAIPTQYVPPVIQISPAPKSQLSETQKLSSKGVSFVSFIPKTTHLDAHTMLLASKRLNLPAA